MISVSFAGRYALILEHLGQVDRGQMTAAWIETMAPRIVLVRRLCLHYFLAQAISNLKFEISNWSCNYGPAATSQESEVIAIAAQLG
jgi:hypothetical protein